MALGRSCRRGLWAGFCQAFPEGSPGVFLCNKTPRIRGFPQGLARACENKVGDSCARRGRVVSLRGGAPGVPLQPRRTPGLNPSPSVRVCKSYTVVHLRFFFALPRGLPQGPPSPSLRCPWENPRRTRTLNPWPRHVVTAERESRDTRSDPKGFPFVIIGLAQGLSGNDVILKDLGMPRVSLGPPEHCKAVHPRVRQGSDRGPRSTPGR